MAVADSFARSVETPQTAVPTSDKPVGFLCLHLWAQPTRSLRREGGEYNTRKGNKPADCLRFLTSRHPVCRHAMDGHFVE